MVAVGSCFKVLQPLRSNQSTSMKCRRPKLIVRDLRMEHRGLEPLTFRMPSKRKNRRNSANSHESRGLSDPADTVLHTVLQG
jgi:hypothetical protein